MKYIENKDYELIPDETGDDVWNVRILEGEFNEVVVRFGSIRINCRDVDNEEDVKLTFDFDVITTPDENLTPENIDLQLFAGDILLSIIESSIENKEEVHFKEV